MAARMSLEKNRMNSSKMSDSLETCMQTKDTVTKITVNNIAKFFELNGGTSSTSKSSCCSY